MSNQKFEDTKLDSLVLNVLTQQQFDNISEEEKKANELYLIKDVPEDKGIYYIEGNTSGDVGKWTGQHDSIKEYYPGLVIAYKIGIAGLSNDTTMLNINGIGDVAVVKNSRTDITTNYPVQSIIILIYTRDNNTPYWKIADYDSNNLVSQSYTTAKNKYPILFRNTSGIESTTNSTGTSRYTNTIYVIPSEGSITANKFIGEATSATSAEKDGSNNVIVDTYMTRINPTGSGIFSFNRRTDNNNIIGSNSVVIGYQGIAEGENSLSLGTEAQAYEKNAIAIGSQAQAYRGCVSIGDSAFSQDAGVAIGANSQAYETALAIGPHCTASNNCVAIGSSSSAKGSYSYTFGNACEAKGQESFSFGIYTKALGRNSYSFGNFTTAYGSNSYINGSSYNQAPNVTSKDEFLNEWQTTKNFSLSYGDYSHVEGYNCLGLGDYSYTHGNQTMASGDYSYAYGNLVIASGNYSCAYGNQATASGSYSYAHGNQAIASGNYSYAHGNQIIASGSCSYVHGRFNIEDTSDEYAHIIGNGDNSETRSNAYTLDWYGNAWFAGNIKIGTEKKEIATRDYVQAYVDEILGNILDEES